MGVELEERQLAVATEEGEADRAEAAPGQVLGVVAERREWPFVGRRWPAAVVVRDDRPDGVAEVLGAFDQLSTLVGAVNGFGVEDGDLPDDRVELGHELVVVRAAQAGVEAEEPEVAGVAAAEVGHDGLPRCGGCVLGRAVAGAGVRPRGRVCGGAPITGQPPPPDSASRV